MTYIGNKMVIPQLLIVFKIYQQESFIGEGDFSSLEDKAVTIGTLLPDVFPCFDAFDGRHEMIKDYTI